MRVFHFTRLTAAATAALLLGSMLAPLPAYADRKGDLQAQVNNSQSEYNDAKNELDEREQQAQATQQQIAQLNGQSAQIYSQLQQLYSTLQETEAQLAAALQEADTAARALEAKQAEYTAHYTQCKEQLYALQRLNDGGTLSVLSQASNLYELLSFAHVLHELHEANTATMETLEAEAAALDAHRLQAEQTAAQVEAVRLDLLNQQTALNQKQDQLAQALQETNDELDEQQAAIEAQKLVTEEARQAYEKALKELDDYVRAQSLQFTTPELHCSLEFGCPLPWVGRVSCQFGEPDAVYGQPHKGCDLPAAGGTPIYSVADGVISVATSHRSYGNYVQVSHGTDDNGNRYDTLYAHMNSYCVNPGQSVKRGQVIGYVGNTGDSKGYHLHLELRVNGGRTNPLAYVPLQ